MNYCDGSRRFPLILFDLVEDSKIILAWDYDYDVCLYGDYHQCLRTGATKLPWLPFTITLEKLKLYLLFS
jgi:hypothetical protein